MRFIKFFVAVAALQAVTFAHAQNVSQDNEEVIVRPPAESDADQVRSFVSELPTPVGRGRIMPRWNGPLCLGVAGMQAEQARVMNNRIGLVAHAVGVTVREPECSPNVLIFFTENADGFASQLAGRTSLVSGDGQSGNSLGGDALREFAETPRAVRWWHVSVTAADGFTAGRDRQSSAHRDQVQSAVDPNEQTEEAQERERDQQAAGAYTNSVRVRNMSRLRGGVTENLARVIIVIDANKVRNVDVGALSDYVAMVTLAQINASADVVSQPSILNLFSDSAEFRADRLTSWDAEYLEGLYRSAEDARSTRDQERQIVRSMMRN